MKRTAFALLATLAISTPVLSTTAHATTGEMSVATFLARADALRAKGAMALFSPEMKTLKAEGMAAGMAYRSRLGAERAAGKPSSCPPKGANVGSDQLLGHLRSYPAAARPQTTMRTALADFFIKTYPCR